MGKYASRDTTGGATVAWGDVTGKPVTFTPALHNNTAHSTEYAPIASPTFTGTISFAGHTIFGTQDGQKFLNIERYHATVPYAIIRCGSSDQNVPVGFSVQTRGNDGAAIDAMLIDGPGNMTVAGKLLVYGS